jgi:DNA-binding transcriptional MocR family regulator
MSDTQLADMATQLKSELEAEYLQLQELGLQLDLTRGKPCTEQLALSDALDGILAGDFRDASGVDVRNYGGLAGLAEARELFGAILGSDAAQTVVGGSSSLTMMYQVMDFALNFGLRGTAWKDAGTVRFLCPVPGYDRHFTVCEHLGIEMIAVPMTDTGPDMDVVEAKLAADTNIRGMWCVPRFSNPTGTVYDAATVQRIARLASIAGPDFLVMWDNAYAVHTLSDTAPVLANINDYCRQYDSAESVFQFGSTSKITFAGAGVAFAASGPNNIKALQQHLANSSIGPDKVNQLRQLRFLRDAEGVDKHMAKHASILAPRFAVVQQHLQEGLTGLDMGQWTQPQGGYFVSFDSRPGLAREIVRLAADIGVKLTPAGATWPYGEDPTDSNIRLAPTYASLADVDTAMRAFVVCVKLASVRQQLGQ